MIFFFLVQIVIYFIQSEATAALGAEGECEIVIVLVQDLQSFCRRLTTRVPEIFLAYSLPEQNLT